MIDDLISIECLILRALFEAEKLGLGTNKNPIDNIDILKYLELFKFKYLEEIGELCHIDSEIIQFLKIPMNFNLNSNKDREFKTNVYLNYSLFVSIFESIKTEYALYLKDKYNIKSPIIFKKEAHYEST